MGRTWLTREERLKGSLAVEKVADRVVLDQDCFRVADMTLKEVVVVMTIVGGKVVWAV